MWFDHKIRIKKSIFNSESKIMYIVVCQSFGGWKVWRKRIVVLKKIDPVIFWFHDCLWLWLALWAGSQSHMEQSIADRHYSVVKITNSVFISAICIVIEWYALKPLVFGQIFLLETCKELKMIHFIFYISFHYIIEFFSNFAF